VRAQSDGGALPLIGGLTGAQALPLPSLRRTSSELSSSALARAARAHDAQGLQTLSKASYNIDRLATALQAAVTTRDASDVASVAVGGTAASPTHFCASCCAASSAQESLPAARERVAVPSARAASPQCFRETAAPLLLALASQARRGARQRFQVASVVGGHMARGDVWVVRAFCAAARAGGADMYTRARQCASKRQRERLLKHAFPPTFREFAGTAAAPKAIPKGWKQKRRARCIIM
jgi:hypothetical protein